LDVQIPNNKIRRLSLPTSSDYNKNIEEVLGKKVKKKLHTFWLLEVLGVKSL
jgi:hypothetical protein